MRPFEIIGHRGARKEAPENTVSGFLYAKQLGLQSIELDVRLTRDNQLVVIHDATVDRTTTTTGAVADFTAAELAAMDARSECPDWPDIVGIPTLEQVLDVTGDFRVVQIEIKKDTEERMEAIVEALVRVIQNRGIQDQVILSSFEPFALEALLRLAPSLPRAYIGDYDTPAFLETALRLTCVQADMSLTTSSADMVAQAHAHGLRVVGFQCNTPEALERALAWNIDGATSDVPSSILPLLPQA